MRTAYRIVAPAALSALLALSAARGEDPRAGARQADHDRARADLAATQVAKARQEIRDDKDRTRYHPDIAAVERAHGGARERAAAIAQLVRRLDPKEDLLEEAVALVSRACGEMLD